MKRTIPMVLPVDQTFNIGKTLRCAGVSDHSYQVPFPFTGKINKLIIDPPKLTPQDVKKPEVAVG